MSKIKLGVNIDHVATVRNARGENYPSPLKAAILAEKSGANSITIHLREDRRHIRENDLKIIKKKIKIPLNLEIAPTKEMTNLAIKHKPDFVCIVPEKRQEITTEGGLNIKKNRNKLKKIIYRLKKNNIKVSLFIEPKIEDIRLSKNMGVHSIELHTGKFCNLLNKKARTFNAFNKLKKASSYAKKIGLYVHAGHGLTYSSAQKLCKINEITEFNIGHFIVSESIFIGMKNSINKFKKILNN